SILLSLCLTALSTTKIYTLSLHDALPIYVVYTDPAGNRLVKGADGNYYPKDTALGADGLPTDKTVQPVAKDQIVTTTVNPDGSTDRKSTRLNSSHVSISYAVFCLKKKTKT